MIKMKCRFFFFIFFLFTSFAHAKGLAVVSANKDATRTGLNILRGGGTAADAAVAMAFVLGVAEPHGSGIGGGGFLLYYEKARNRFWFLDYREAAPAVAKNEDYAPTATANEGRLSDTGAKAAAVPGFVAGMDDIHKRFGKRAWADLLMPAIDLARAGFVPSDFLKQKYVGEKERLGSQAGMALFFDKALTAKNDVLKMENLALTMEKIQKGGAEEFYRGALARVILAELKAAGSVIGAEDLDSYRVFSRKPYDFLFNDYRILSAPLPSTGGIFLEEALRGAQDAGVKSGTPAFTEWFAKELVTYFAKRNGLADTEAGILGDTTHLCVIDAEGNIAAMTNTINSAFGSGVILPGTGILLNNEMDDFVFDPNKKSANHINDRNRPLSSMSPTIVFKGFNPVLVLGTPGGLTIPLNIYQVLQRHLVEGQSLWAAMAEPKFYSFPQQEKAFYEKGYNALSQSLTLKPTQAEKPVGNVQAILIDGDKLDPVSDPRGEGVGGK